VEFVYFDDTQGADFVTDPGDRGRAAPCPTGAQARTGGQRELVRAGIGVRSAETDRIYGYW
jgi:hypothetical protein